MALVIGGNATVATGMSPIVEAGLYADPIFIDGVTFSSRYNIGSAGQIQVEVYKGGRGVKPKSPGTDFTDRDYENTVVDINVNNGFQDSAKVPSYFQNTMPTGVLMNKTLEVSEKIRSGRQESALAALANMGKASDNTDALTKDNIKEVILDHVGKLNKKHAKPDVVLASVDTYNLMLAVAGKEYTPMYNDIATRTGLVGIWGGMLWVKATLLNGEISDLSYLNETGNNTVVDTSGIDFIMYDHMAYSIIDRLDMLRVKDSEMFNGSKVQGEIASGFKVTNEDCVLVKKAEA